MLRLIVSILRGLDISVKFNACLGTDGLINTIVIHESRLSELGDVFVTPAENTIGVDELIAHITNLESQIM